MSPRKARTFDPKAFLAQTGLGRTILQCPRNTVIFAQGDPSDAVFYIQAGRARLNVLSTRGKEATIAMLAEGTSWVKMVLPLTSPGALRLPPQLQIVVY